MFEFDVDAFPAFDVARIGLIDQEDRLKSPVGGDAAELRARFDETTDVSVCRAASRTSRAARSAAEACFGSATRAIDTTLPAQWATIVSSLSCRLVVGQLRLERLQLFLGHRQLGRILRRAGSDRPVPPAERENCVWSSRYFCSLSGSASTSSTSPCDNHPRRDRRGPSARIPGTAL